MSIFAKTKDIALLFGFNLWFFKLGLFCQKAKVIVLLIGLKFVYSNESIFAKTKDIALLFGFKSVVFQIKPIFAKKQRL